MDFSKLKNKLLIIFCLIVLILPFYLITFSYADYEDYTVISASDVISNLSANASNNKFFGFGGSSSFVYDISSSDYVVINGDTSNIFVCFSNDFPAVNVEYYEGVSVSTSQSYYIDLSDKDYNYLVITMGSSHNDFSVLVKSDGLNNAVDGLVNNVGIDNIWNIFDISINYIVVVVLVAFGIFIIIRTIKKISKGKEGL